MKKMCAIAAATLLVFLSFHNADALIIFQDTFNSESPGAYMPNYNSFANWDVSNGTVDRLWEEVYMPWSTGHGGFVDMDGSTSNAGKLTTKSSFLLLPGDYVLKFEFAGNNRGYDPLAHNPDKIDVTVGSLLSKAYSLPIESPFVLFYETFSASVNTYVQLSFEGYGGDNIGMFLDNVSLETAPIPEPATMLLLGSGLIGFAGARRKLKK